MISVLSDIDTTLFFFLNTSIANAFLDWLMPIVTNKRNLYWPGGLLALWLLFKGGRDGHITLALVVLAIIFADQLTSSFLKPFTERLRPCKALEGFRLLTHCGSWYGFPSSHAANSAAVATVLSGFFRRGRWPLAILAITIGFSRIYVGVHYPSDVLVGWGIGLAIGLALLAMRDSLQKRYPLLQSPPA